MSSTRTLFSASVPLIRKNRLRARPLVLSPTFTRTLNLITPRAPDCGAVGVCAEVIRVKPTLKPTSKPAVSLRLIDCIELFWRIAGYRDTLPDAAVFETESLRDLGCAGTLEMASARPGQIFDRTGWPPPVRIRCRQPLKLCR